MASNNLLVCKYSIGVTLYSSLNTLLKCLSLTPKIFATSSILLSSAIFSSNSFTALAAIVLEESILEFPGASSGLQIKQGLKPSASASYWSAINAC